MTDSSSRRDARGRAGNDADTAGSAAGSRDSRTPGPLDLPSTERKRGDGELVN